jgi:hypothetical protein
MKRLNFLIISLFCAFSLFSQNNGKIVPISFVDNDTIYLRFSVQDNLVFKDILNYGFKIERFENSLDNISSKQTFFLAPAKDVIQSEKYNNDEKFKEIKELIQDFITMSPNDEGFEMLYAILMLSSVTDKDYLNGLGLIFYDTSFEKNKNYLYRISINSNKEEFKKYTTTFEVNTTKNDVNPSFESLEYEARIKTEEVFLQWNTTEISSSYSSYWVEKSLDSINYETLNSAPLFLVKSQYETDKTKANFVDTAVTEGMMYYYRIRGVNHFAEKGETSNVVKVFVKRSLKGIVKIDTIYALKNNRILKGEYSAIDNIDSQNLSHFIVLRSDSLKEGYKILKSSNLKSNNEFEFHVTSPLLTGERYYYKVAAISVDGDTSMSFHYYYYTLDQEPPNVPVGLEGTIDDKGIVHLKWNNNTDEPLKGYRVFWANSIREEFVETTHDFVKDTIFTDTVSLKTLTSEVYYTISAVDLNFNNSKRCEPIKLLKPDTIPPVKCNINYIKVTQKGVVVKWINSSSEDVSLNHLVRKEFETNKIDTIFSWSDTSSTFLDQFLDIGKTYTYHISTLDDQSNVSNSKRVNVINETGVRPSISDLSNTIDRENKTIKLNWSQDNTLVYSYKIYRSKNEGRFILYKTFEPNDSNEYIDENLSINNTYSYKIKVVYNNGINSPFSETIIVKF